MSLLIKILRSNVHTYAYQFSNAHPKTYVFPPRRSQAMPKTVLFRFDLLKLIRTQPQCSITKSYIWNSSLKSNRETVKQRRLRWRKVIQKKFSGTASGPLESIQLESSINQWMIFFGKYFVKSIASISGFVQSMNALEIETKSLKYSFGHFDSYLGHSNGCSRSFYSWIRSFKNPKL